ATHEAEREGHAADGVRLDIVTNVKRAYYDLWKAYQRLRVLERERELVERFTHVAEEKYATGAATQADVLRSQVELTHLINQVQRERLAREPAGAELTALPSPTPGEPLGVPEAPPPPRLSDSPAALAALALEKRPELAAQGSAIAREESAVALSQRNRLPDF